MGLNLKSVRNLFEVDFRKESKFPPSVTNFSVFCIIIGLFLFVELFGISRIVGSSVTARFFVGLLGFVYILIGIGIWQSNPFAFQAASPVVIFTVLSVTIIVIYDYFELKRIMALQRSTFYIMKSLGMLLYWWKFVKGFRGELTS